MAFTKFDLPNKAPDAHCNARVRLDGVEAYCPVETNETRCPAHNGSNVKKAKAEKAKQAKQAQGNTWNLNDWVKIHLWDDKMWRDRSYLMSLDYEIFALGAIIDELANRKPLGGLTFEDAERLTKLMKTHADFVTARANLLLRFWDLEMKSGENCLSMSYVGYADAAKDFAVFEERMAAYGGSANYGFGKKPTQGGATTSATTAQGNSEVQAQQPSPTLSNGSTQAQIV